MENPWTHLPSAQPYVLPGDERAVTQFNASAEVIHKVRTELLPEPYLGRFDAEIILLNLNPGFSEDDHLLYEQPNARMLWRKNIMHESLDYPFFLLDPELSKFPGPQWWQKHLKEPIQVSDQKTVANQICCIECFPYHSRKFAWANEFLESQKYSFHLAELAIARGALIIIMRGAKQWHEAVPQLSKYEKKFQLNSPQNVTISKGNCPDGFPEINRILRSSKAS